MADYEIKKTKELIDKLKPYWKELQKIQTNFVTSLIEIEQKMEKETGIKDIEFFQSDVGYCGIGNVQRTMALVHDTELEEEKNASN